MYLIDQNKKDHVNLLGFSIKKSRTNKVTGEINWLSDHKVEANPQEKLQKYTARKKKTPESS